MTADDVTTLDVAPPCPGCDHRMGLSMIEIMPRAPPRAAVRHSAPTLTWLASRRRLMGGHTTARPVVWGTLWRFDLIDRFPCQA
jgi:hypothetical protein